MFNKTAFQWCFVSLSVIFQLVNKIMNNASVWVGLEIIYTLKTMLCCYTMLEYVIIWGYSNIFVYE